MKRQLSEELPKQTRSDIIKLNVGGWRFQTTLATLSSASYFSQTGAMAYETDSSGYVFIDRCGACFSVILQHLRDLRRPSQSLIDRYGDTLIQECDFFGIDSLKQKIRGLSCPQDLRWSDRVIRNDEVTACSNLTECAKRMLLDVHAIDTSLLHQDSLELPLLLQGKATRPEVKGSFLNFYERLNNFSGHLLDDLKMLKGIVVAGGSVLGALTDTPAGDLDVFLSVTPEHAETVTKAIFEAVQKSQRKISKTRNLMVTRSDHAVTFYRISDRVVTSPPIQVTLGTCTFN